ncbi:cdh-10, partial [Pristionchus pacificus]|uniref:Cadherin domain-containing protein n=1 Tax=Pristionchus pacificus TaxID=54126 RepID=A0A8R1UB96_PRIPA
GSLLHDDPLLDDEYRSHFVESNYDFMIPEGQQEKPSIAAILSFVSDPAVESPTFSIHDDFDWFTIGSQKSQVNGEGILETEVSIDTKEGVLIDSKRVDGENYSLQVTGISGNRSVSVPVRVDILPSFGVIKVMSEDIKSQSTKKEDESEIAVDSREEIEGREVKTSPKITPTTTELTTTEITREEPTTTSFPTTVSTTTTTQTTTVPTTVSTTPTTISSTSTETTPVTVPSTTVTTTESTTTSTTTEPSTTSTSQLTTTATVPIRLNIEGLSESGSIPVMTSLSKGELINNFAITVERDGRPDGTLFNVTVDRSDLFDIQPKSVEQGGKAFLFVRNPHLIREIKGLTITIKAASSLTSDSTSLPIFLITDSSSEIIRFSIPESSSNGIKIGDLPDRSIERILALDGLPFNLVKSSLFLSCETPQCLDRETNDHYEFFVKFTDSAYPIPVVVSVSDINDNPPTISLTEHIIRVASNRLLNPVAVFISDLDSSSDSNAILLTGDASHYFTVKHIEEGIYDLQLTSSPSNGNYSLTVTVVDTTHPEFPSHSIDVAIVVQRGKARFRKELYERTLAADKITSGDSLLRLELEGVPIDEVDIMCLGGNPGWITVEPYGGKMSVATLPRKGIEGGEFTVVMGAIDRETSELVADTRVKITVEGGVKKEKKILSPFHKNIYTFKTIREHSESDSHSSFSVDLDVRNSSVSPSLIPSSLFALDSNGISTSFPISSLSLNGSTLSIERSSFANLRLLQIEVEAEEQTASVLIFFSSSSIVMERLRRERSRPLFAIPEGTEDDPIEISMMEESPSGTVVAVFPATDVSKGENVETRLEGEMKEFFHIQQTTGALIIAHPFDLESLSSPFFNLSLLAGEEPFESRLSLHFTVLNIDDNPPIVHTDSRMINTTIWENAALSSRVAIIKASDIDSPSLRFTLVGEKADKFAVKSSEEGGIITIEKEIDREEDGDQLSLIVLVIDSAGHTAEAMVNIRIMDVNDNSPSFVSIHSTQLKAVENWGEGRLLSILTAEDEDEGENGRVMYRLTQSSPYISIDKLTGELKLARNLIGMAGVEIGMTVMAHDMGSPQRSTLLNLTVSILESMGKESLTPKIINLPEDFVIQVNDQSPIRSRVFTVSALSPSGGKEGLKYDLLVSSPSLLSSSFLLHLSHQLHQKQVGWM